METWARSQYQSQHLDEDEIPYWELNHNCPARDVVSTITELSALVFIMSKISEQDVMAQSSLLVHGEGPWGTEE
jgi:hypothetical protein